MQTTIDNADANGHPPQIVWIFLAKPAMFETRLHCETSSLPSAVGRQERSQVGADMRAVSVSNAMHKIMVVDDELWSALDMEWVVQKLGHEVVGPAATSEQAISLAEEIRPDLVLMDIRLAYNGDGIAAAIEIRRRFDISSIFVSAHGDTLTRKRALAARPSGFIEKPFTPDALAHAIETALNDSDSEN